MSELRLKAEPRTVTGRRPVRRLRRTGLIPAVLYGPTTEPRNLQLRAVDVERVLQIGGTTQLVDLTIEGEGEQPVKVLIRDLQRHPIKRSLLHVDLIEVSLKEKLEVEVPIVLVGQSPAEAAGIGTPSQVLDTIAVYCLPTDIPAQLQVDISTLTPEHDVIRAEEVPLPEGVELAEEPDAAVVVLEYISEEAEGEAVEEEEAMEAEPEVIARGKAEEEEEEE
ncbi:MAG: 50S ribosomal protein L25 [Chloroflexi bacterium]|nr:50S ribosomal protein L25 [Chloroflexota bacterium]